MTEKKNIDWIAAGVSALALWDVQNQTLVSKGILTPQERLSILDTAISSLSGNPETASAAQNIRTIFNRP